MIKLRNDPIEGAASVLNLSFRDGFGNYYVPDSLNYTMLALNSDEESWRVIDGIYEKELEPASSVVIATPPASIIEGTTLARKMVIKWTATVGGTYSDFVDEAQWTVQPRPYVPDAPAPVPTERFVEIASVSVVGGSMAATPQCPVFKLKANVPVSLAEASFLITNAQGFEGECEVELDESETVILVSRVLPLSGFKEFKLNVSGLTAKVGGYGMKGEFSVPFKTGYKPVSNGVFREFTENGDYVVEPPEGYDSMMKVEVKVAVPDQIALYAYMGESAAKIFWASREITESGTYKILPEGDSFGSFLIGVEDGVISFIYDGAAETLVRHSQDDILR